MSIVSRSFWRGLGVAGFLAVAERSNAANEYIYGIGSDWALYQLTVDPVANTVSVAKQSINLTSFISGWGTRYNEVLNGLGVDPSTGDIYFNYSYNSSSTSTSGTMSVVPYVYQVQNGAYKIPYALGAAISSPTLAATDASGGWMPRATYYNGAYYAGMQASDTFVVLPITGTTTKSYTSILQYTDWDHTTGTTSMSGGDFVLGSNGVVYGATDSGGANIFFRQQLSNATNVSSGASWTNFNIDASIPYATQGSIQVAGLGASTNLYVASTTGQNLYRINGYNSSSAPTFSQVGGSAALGVTFTDLSTVVSAPLPVPEMPSGGAVVSMILLGGGWEIVRQTQKWNRRGARCSGPPDERKVAVLN